MFKTDMVLRALTADLWAFEAPLVWLGLGETITVPRGFVTDLASIPRAFRNLPLTDPNGISRRPAGIHDALYALGRDRGKDFADNLLREMLISEGMSGAGAGLYYYAVHWFGGPSWRSDARDVIGNCACSGDFIPKQAYQDWKDAGASLFKPL